MNTESVSRRKCIGRIISVLPLLYAPGKSISEEVFSSDSYQSIGNDFWVYPRWIWLHRPATGEQIKITYWKDGHLIDEAYKKISWFMRDARFEQMLASNSPVISRALVNGVIGPEHLSPWMMMDPYLLDILYAYCAWLSFFGISKPLVLTSALRHILTNAMTEGAVKDSWHTKGAAADVVIPGVSAVQVSNFGKWLGGGGVGLYLQKNFVHLDRGRIRSWIKN